MTNHFKRRKHFCRFESGFCSLTCVTVSLAKEYRVVNLGLWLGSTNFEEQSELRGIAGINRLRSGSSTCRREA